MLLASGLGPKGMMRIRYGGVPSLPLIATVRLPHWVGASWNDHVYAWTPLRTVAAVRKRRWAPRWEGEGAMMEGGGSCRPNLPVVDPHDVTVGHVTRTINYSHVSVNIPIFITFIFITFTFTALNFDSK